MAEPGGPAPGTERLSAGRRTDVVPVFLFDLAVAAAWLRDGFGTVVIQRGSLRRGQFLRLVLSGYATADPDTADLPGPAAAGCGARGDQRGHHCAFAELRRLPQRDLSRGHHGRGTRSAGSGSRPGPAPHGDLCAHRPAAS